MQSARTVNEARSLNNEGIHCIQNDLFQEATVTLTEGLTIVQSLLWQEQETISIGEEDDSEDDFCHRFPFATVKRQRKQEGCHFIFVHPITISDDVVGESFCSNKLCAEMSFALLYNLALAHHLQAIQKGSPVVLLSKALHLYGLAYTVLQEEELFTTCYHFMALLNNMGQLYSVLDDGEERSTVCFRKLLSTLLFVYDGTSLNTPGADNKEIFDGFFSSVMHLILKESAAAAA